MILSQSNNRPLAANMKSNKQGHLQRKFSPEAREQRGISDLPIRTKEAQDTDNLLILNIMS
ncbi:hypothetical protein BofuT4_uP144570.1 [Botrytis cinerea T4]|uniref:Uncharacterized protein n=1 Tax=Botryotinia fuckeliana (strain T4) TaxID=999810 RepID=G2YYF1_BOTF4|nr:hypothetical protein BofuT4_uP144570.1 [Botrytis cinerea T4]